MTNLPERNPAKSNAEQGIYRKFDVRRTDGSDQPGGKHEGCEYFVLDVNHDPHALAALAAYANACQATHPELAADLRKRYSLHEPNAKLLELADLVDHEELWTRPLLERWSLTAEQIVRLDAGVALRRYADLLGEGGWRVYPPRPGICFRASTLERAAAMARRDEERRNRPCDGPPGCNAGNCLGCGETT